jgi:hypothetical protein
MSGDYFFFLLFFGSLALIGMRKMWSTFDTGGKVKNAAQNGLAGLVGRLFK